MLLSQCLWVNLYFFSTKPPLLYIVYLTDGFTSTAVFLCSHILVMAHIVSAICFYLRVQYLCIYSKKLPLCLPASKRFNPPISTRGLHSYRIMFHQSYPSKHDYLHHREVKTLDISSSKVMQIDSSPRACQVHPAGTPKGQGQYHTCYSLERNIWC